VYEFPDRTIKQGRATGRGKAGRLCDAIAAEVVIAAGCQKGNTANHAKRRRYKSAGFHTGDAEVDRAGIGDKCLAIMATGREEDIEQCFQHGVSVTFCRFIFQMMGSHFRPELFN
jgi:hypothetical protein